MSAVSHQPLFVLDHACVIHNSDGTKTLRWGAGATDPASTEVFSLQPDGTVQTRPDTAIGAWEKGTVKGDRLVFRVENARAVFAWQD